MNWSKIHTRNLLNATLSIALAIAFCLIFGVLVLNFAGEHLHISVPEDSLMFTFIGILATFIVVGNLTQVMSIKEQMNSDISRLESKVSAVDTNVNSLSKKWNKDIQDSAIAQEQFTIDRTSLLYKSLIKVYEAGLLNHLFYFINEENKEYKVTSHNGQVEDAYAKIKGKEIKFYKKANDEEIMDIKDVDGKSYSAESINAALPLILGIVKDRPILGMEENQDNDY